MFDERFAREGILVLERLLPPDLIEAVAAEASCWPRDSLDAPALKIDKDRLHMAARIQGPLLDSRLWGDPRLEAILNVLLGGSYVVDSVSLVVALPGAPMMRLHRDFPDLFPELPQGKFLPAHAVTMVVPLVPTDDATGTTMVARSSMASRKIDTDTLDPPADWIVPHVPLGGCVLMDFRLWHRGLPNTSQRERPILYIVFARDWFTDCLNYDHHPRMIIDRDSLMAIDPAHRRRWRRAAGAGMTDVSMAELGGRRDDGKSLPNAGATPPA